MFFTDQTKRGNDTF